MAKILHLRNFVVTRLHADWHQKKEAVSENTPVQETYGIDYDVLRNNEAPTSFALKFRHRYYQEVVGEKTGLELESEIVGFFDFGDSLDESMMQTLIRVNGCAILYGILRGQVASFTGSFPDGKCLLPTLSMQDVVKQVESTRQNAVAQVNKQKKSAAKPASKAKTKSR